MPFDLSSFSMSDMVTCGREIRSLGTAATSMEAAAAEVVQYLDEQLIDPHLGSKSCVLVRLFKTHDFSQLDEGARQFAVGMMPEVAGMPNCKCFTLLATAGLEEAWKTRRGSRGHQTIPLPSAEVVEKIPMMRNLIKQTGMDVGTLVRPDPYLLLDMAQRTFNVFYVADAEGSPYIPAQESFVKAYGVKSVLGFGAALPSGDVEVIIIFSRTRIPPQTAGLFRSLALSVKMVLLPFEHAVFPADTRHEREAA